MPRGPEKRGESDAILFHEHTLHGDFLLIFEPLDTRVHRMLGALLIRGVNLVIADRSDLRKYRL